MGRRRQPIQDFCEKVAELQRIAGFGDKQENFLAFADWLGINRDGLRACISDTGTRGLGTDHTQSFRKAFASKLGDFTAWPEWLETDEARIAKGERRDSAGAFATRCADVLVGLASGVPQLTIRRIEERISTLDPDQNVYVELTVQSQAVTPTTMPFDAELVCQTFRHLGVPLNIRRGTLRIEISRPEITPRMADRRTAAGGGEERHTFPKNTITVRASGRDFMQWVIEADRAPIGILIMPLNDLFKLRGFREGDTVEAVFFVEDQDLVAADDDKGGREDSLQIVHEGLAVDDPAVEFPKGEPENHAKRMLLAHLAKMSLGLFDDDRGRGSATLARYAVKIVPVDQTADDGVSNDG